MNGHSNGAGPGADDGALNESSKALIETKLPKELILRIFSFLDVVSLCRSAQVSKVSNCWRLLSLNA